IPSIEPQRGIAIDDLDVREPLPIRAHLFLAFHDENTVSLEHAGGFSAALLVESNDRGVPLGALPAGGPAARISRPKGCVRARAGKLACRTTKKSLHVRRIEDHAVEFVVRIRKLAAIGAGLEVRPMNVVVTRRNVLPEHTTTPRDVGDLRALRNVQSKDLREHLRIAADVRRHDHIGGGLAALNSLCSDVHTKASRSATADSRYRRTRA